MSFEMDVLISKLSPVCLTALERAAETCLSQTHYNVEIEHLFLELLNDSRSDLNLLFERLELPKEDIIQELRESQEEFKRGNSRAPAFSKHLLDLFQEALLNASMNLGECTISSGALFWSLLTKDWLKRMITNSSPSLGKVSLEAFKGDYWEFLKIGEELSNPKTNKVDYTEILPDSEHPNLDLYTINLTAKAEEGKIDPIIGRDSEIRQLIDILIRRRQNNPILTGEAGVGKTSVVEGFVLKVLEGSVPDLLKGCSVLLLDLGLLQAGAGMQGEFEKRLNSVIREVKESEKLIILFIDEAHNLIGAGGGSGQGDAANLLKPALARGELMTIAATTHSEYKQYFEKDPALARRFQEVFVREPDEEKAVQMLRGLKEKMEQHHKVEILDESIKDAVKLSTRYISGRQLPDKAISLLDTACARVSISQKSMPAALDDLKSRAGLIETEKNILTKELTRGGDHQAKLDDLTLEKKDLGNQIKILNDRWEKEKSIVSELKEIYSKQTEDSDKKTDTVQLDKKRLELQKKLEKIQSEDSMVHLQVSKFVIADVVAGWTGIPISKMLKEEINTLLDLKKNMAERLIGQSHALEAISKRIQTSRASMDDPNRPVGVFLLAGPSGVGKTETAVTLADLLYGGERNMVTINMSEYQEAHTVSSLKGAPPGYVGYGKGGVLTEAVRKSPHTVILLDEVEKAHPDVMDLFYQVFDKGTLEDGEGVTIDFKNTVILLTSNLGTQTISKYCRDKKNAPNSDELSKLVKDDLLSFFKPALLGRMVVIPYFPLFKEEIEKIVALKLSKVKKRVLENHQAKLEISPKVNEFIAENCVSADKGARVIDQMISHSILPDLSIKILNSLALKQEFSEIKISLDKDNNFSYSLS